MDFTAVDNYLHKLYYTDYYTKLDQALREKIAFTAEEMLKRYFKEDLITDKVVALQTLYIIEGESEEFAMFKRQGVKSFSIKGMSFSFEGKNISPEVTALIRQNGSAIGRLI
jgi:hypothetical protein